MSDQEQTKLKVKYETMSAQYASQCILNSTKEEILLDFSSGVVPDPDSGQPVVPVHTRIAMTMGGAMRLRNLLDKALNKAVSQTAPAARPKVTSASATSTSASRPAVTKKKPAKKEDDK